MTILITGGRGKTSSQLAKLLTQADIPFIHASHSPSVISGSRQQCHFDWTDQTTWTNSIPQSSDVHAVYLVGPPLLDMVEPMKSFIEFAKARGVRRFVLLSASAVPIGGPAMGQVHAFLAGLGVEYTVLRPTWFMENFSDQHSRGDLRTGDTIYSATGNGKVPFVAAADIALVAFHALTDEVSYNTDYVVLGPELLSYDEISRILGDVLQRCIRHKNLSKSELTARFLSQGIPENYTEVLASLDTAIAEGMENRLNDVVLNITGRQPKSFAEFVKENRDVWRPEPSRFRS